MKIVTASPEKIARTLLANEPVHPGLRELHGRVMQAHLAELVRLYDVEPSKPTNVVPFRAGRPLSFGSASV
jgi:hypothetical protein